MDSALGTAQAHQVKADSSTAKQRSAVFQGLLQESGYLSVPTSAIKDVHEINPLLKDSKHLFVTHGAKQDLTKSSKEGDKKAQADLDRALDDIAKGHREAALKDAKQITLDGGSNPHFIRARQMVEDHFESREQAEKDTHLDSAQRDLARGDDPQSLSKALQEVNQAAKDDPANQSAWFTRARIERAMGAQAQGEAAQRLFAQAGEDDLTAAFIAKSGAEGRPADSIALNNMSSDINWLASTEPTATKQSSDNKLAVTVAQASVEADTSATHLDTLAFSEALFGDYKGAEQHMHAALTLYAQGDENMSVDQLLAKLRSNPDLYKDNGQALYHMGFISNKLAQSSSGEQANQYKRQAQEFMTLSEEDGYVPQKWETLLH